MLQSATEGLLPILRYVRIPALVITERKLINISVVSAASAAAGEKEVHGAANTRLADTAPRRQRP
jgi:hypothetical protein